MPMSLLVITSMCMPKMESIGQPLMRDRLHGQTDGQNVKIYIYIDIYGQFFCDVHTFVQLFYAFMPLYTLNQEAELEMVKGIVNYRYRRKIIPSDFSLTFTQALWLSDKDFVTYTTYKPPKKKKKKCWSEFIPKYYLDIFYIA